MKTKREFSENWIERYEDDIRDFLNENYFHSGETIGIDYSVYIDIENGKIFEKVEPSFNWEFMHANENRKLIVHLNNHDKAFFDWTDLVAIGNKKEIEENLSVELPENFEEMDFDEQKEWIENNVDPESLDEYNRIMRDEAIDNIIENIKE